MVANVYFLNNTSKLPSNRSIYIYTNCRFESLLEPTEDSTNIDQ